MPNIRSFSLIVMTLACTNGIAQNVISTPFKFVNSKYDEQNPIISPDGKALYFTIANHPQNSGGKKDPGDIWISTLVKGEWTQPSLAGAINDVAYNAVAGFSADGSQIFLLSHYGKNGDVAKTQGISVSRKTDFGWTSPENLSIPYFLNRSSAFSGMITPEGDIFIFSAESYVTKGAEDIYVSLKKDGKWSEPVNLGPIINTSFQEWTPSLSADQKTIYFSSNGRKGLGGFDVYSSTRLDDSWTSWSEPVSVAIVNSDSRELFYRAASNGQTLFTTTSNSDGYGDIRAVIDSTLQLDSVKRNTAPPILTNKKRILVSGKISNSKTGAGIRAYVSFKADTIFNVSSSIDGRFDSEINSGKAYNIQVQSPGFVSISERLDSRELDPGTIEMNFKLQPIEIGTKVNLKNILFYMGTTSLLEESYAELDVVVEFLKSNPKVEIELEGHTDNRGDAKKNQLLSQQRVDRIKTYLITKGISAKRIKGKGFGGTRPISTNDNEETRKLNRRVEFVIIKD